MRKKVFLAILILSIIVFLVSFWTFMYYKGYRSKMIRKTEWQACCLLLSFILVLVSLEDYAMCEITERSWALIVKGVFALALGALSSWNNITYYWNNITYYFLEMRIAGPIVALCTILIAALYPLGIESKHYKKEQKNEGEK